MLCCKARPYAPILICMGIVYPFEFFQLDMQGGTFQSYWSFFVGLRGGDLRICGGGDPGPFGNLRCL